MSFNEKETIGKLRTTLIPYSVVKSMVPTLSRRSIYKTLSPTLIIFICCRSLSTESNAQVLSRFMIGLRPDLKNELLAQKITNLEKSYILAHDSDMFGTRYTPSSQESEIPEMEPTSSQLPSQACNLMLTLEIPHFTHSQKSLIRVVKW